MSLGRVRLLLSKGHSCYRPRRTGERKRKSVRGCIVDANLSVLALVVVRKGEQVRNFTILILETAPNFTFTSFGCILLFCQLREFNERVSVQFELKG